MFMKNDFHLDCNCHVCSGLSPAQENLAMELYDLFQTLPSGLFHHRKGLSDWAIEAEIFDKINDKMQDFQLGNWNCKATSLMSLVRTAQLARNQDLVNKGLEMFMSFYEDTKLEEIGLLYEKLEGDLAQWSSNLQSRKKPSLNEIEFFVTLNVKRLAV